LHGAAPRASYRVNVSEGEGFTGVARVIAVFNHHESTLRLFQVLLTKRGFVVHTHKQEVTSLEDVVNEQPDLIILGYITGFSENEVEMIHELASNPVTSQIPILVATTAPKPVERALKHEHIPYIEIVEKPFNVDELLSAIDELLAEKDAAMAKRD
jgi:DNA-binding NtrC family response regulator